MVLYPIGATKACQVCSRILQTSGAVVMDHPAPEITHLLLDVPAFGPDGMLRSGEDIRHFLPMLPSDITVIGGNLKHPALDGYRCLDFLKEEAYLAPNAAITADCAIRLAGTEMDFVFRGSRALVIGWGRIGKCLAQILRGLACHVTIAARKEEHRAMAEALGFRAVEIGQIPNHLADTQLLFNTVPAPVVPVPIPNHCLALELASRDGIFGDKVITARGLPGKFAPESAGALMAQYIANHIKEGSQ